MFDGLTHTVTTTHVTTTTDDLGDSTDTKTASTASGILFAPEGLVESVTSDSPRLIGDATLFGKLPALDSDDTVSHLASCCDGGDFAHGFWQVVGGSKGWGKGDRTVPIRRTAVA